MPITALPPVRTRVPLRRCTSAQGRSAIGSLFPGGRVVLVGSGTQALAAALRDAALHAGVAQGEAIVPAYGCPDLVTACIAAGLQPRLVDVDSGGWGYDLAGLEAALRPDTVAVVAVNLLGLGDDAARIATLAAPRGIRIVHDSAQWFPDAPVKWLGDSVVLSFGRGKPLNLLGGGALVSLDVSERSCADEAPERPAGGFNQGVLGALAFNALSHPWLYGLATRLPMLRVGETRYREPSRLERQADEGFGRIAAAVAAFPKAHSATGLWPSAAGWREFGIETLQPASGTPPASRLRLALMARDRAHRDALLRALGTQGFGQSAMYGAALPAIAGLPSVAATQGPFPNAERLAARLFTLPTHSFVHGEIVARATAVIRAV